ncbi:LLM class flavin-dependent oxidoreductase [Streptomyces sp. CNQ085]|uniref:LLM class flavin-dependent oxidoreductase n=1 Tax=Streptomyces sp. CNQ085 TaxID=2886944 RepID=UPI001F506D97|nr:LLM class flavin-dependent oxidoreductase [Streptomyces sp. CNQ085]MCI0385829.1 LLM class flavin-dependent oxidoreductase [Streptomyces sp. CNQ085]
MTISTIGFGAFISPLHPLGEAPDLQMWRDLQLISWLDELGLEEVWVGEHHSGGWGTVSSPEIFLAAAAERTRRIRLGTGVVSLPYHHPFHAASRIVQLDHMTRGRVMFGIGAGSSPADAHMLGVEAVDTRRMAAEALEVIDPLLRGEAVTRSTDWFTLRDARLHLAPYSGDLELAVSSASSPSGMRLAGRYGLSPLSFGAPVPGAPAIDLAGQWAHAEQEAAEHGRTMDRSRWRIVLPVHVAETTKQAYADVREGFRRFAYGYFRDTLGLPVEFPGVPAGEEVEAMVEAGAALIGSVEDCVEAVERLAERTGGFGRLLVAVNDWASRGATLHSFELLTRFVAPHFNGRARSLHESNRWVRENRSVFMDKAAEAFRRATSA